jgi:hypothetical protein
MWRPGTLSLKKDLEKDMPVKPEIVARIAGVSLASTLLIAGTGLVSIASAAPPPSSGGTASSTVKSPALQPVLQPKGLKGKTLPAQACSPDLTITRMVLTRSGPTRSTVSVTVEVKNIGRDGFTSDPRQVGVSAALTNGSTSAVTSLDLGSLGQLAAGATRTLSAVTPVMPFDTFEFGGEARASINYDPDILLDGQPCNDDKVYANNAFALSNDTVRAWLGTSNNRLDVTR